MAVVNQEVDLTINSMFASDDNKNLLLRPAWQYDRDFGGDDGRQRILGMNLSLRDAMTSNILRIVTDDEMAEEHRKRQVEYDSAACFRNLFGKYPQWYIRDYDDYEEGVECHRCGCSLNCLNQYKDTSLCDRCNEESGGSSISYAEESGMTITTQAEADFYQFNGIAMSYSNLALREEEFFANGGAVQTEDNTVPDMTMNQQGEITVRSGAYILNSLAP